MSLLRIHFLRPSGNLLCSRYATKPSSNFFLNQKMKRVRPHDCVNHAEVMSNEADWMRVRTIALYRQQLLKLI